MSPNTTVAVRVIKARIEEIRAVRLMTEDDLDMSCRAIVHAVMGHFIELKRTVRQRGKELEQVLTVPENQP